MGHIVNRLGAALYREAVNLVDQGIASVGAIDAAVRHGPGMRLAVLGPHLAFHLAGGPGGFAAYMDHLGAGQVRRWNDLGRPTLDAALKAKLLKGIEAEAAGRSVEDLELERDARLVALRKALVAVGDQGRN